MSVLDLLDVLAATGHDSLAHDAPGAAMISRQLIPWKTPWTIEILEPGLLRVFILTTGQTFLLRVAPESTAS